MSDFDPIAIELAINSPEVLKQAVEVENALKGLDKKVNFTEAQFKEFLKEQSKASEAIGKQNPQISVTKRKFDSLGHSINQITRELPAFTYSAQTGFMAISNNIPMLVDEISRLKQQNNELIASGKKGVPVWRQLMKSMFSWQTLLSLGVTLITVYGKEIGQFFSNVFKGKQKLNEFAETIKAINKTFKSTSYAKAREEVAKMTSQIQLAKDGKLDAIKVLNQYNKGLGKVIGSVKDLDQAESNLLKKKDAYVKMMLYKSAASAFLQSSNEQIIELVQKEASLQDKLNTAKKRVAEYSKLSTSEDVIISTKTDRFDSYSGIAKRKADGLKSAVSEAKSELQELEKQQTKIYQDILGKAAKLANENGLNFFTENDVKNIKTEINNRKQLLQKLADLDAEYSRKQLTKNKAELQALRDKFGKIRKLITDFNANDKNKAKIDITGLNGLQKRAETTLKYRQETNELGKKLEKEKELFALYEKTKTEIGKDEADNRYKHLLNGFKNYGELLQLEFDKLQNRLNTKEPNKVTGAETERLLMLSKRIELYKNNQARKEQQRFVKVYQSLLTHQEKITQIEADFEQKRIEIAKVSNKEIREAKLKELEYQKQQAIVVAYTEEYERKRIYEKGRYKELLNEKKFWSKKLTLSEKGADGYIAIQKKISESNKKINQYLFAETRSMLNEIGNFFDSVGNESMSDFINGLKDVASQLSNVYSTFSDENSTGLTKATSLVGLIVTASDYAKDFGESMYNSELNLQKEKNKGLLNQLTVEKELNRLRSERLKIERESSAFLKSDSAQSFKDILKEKSDSENFLNESLKVLSKNAIFSQQATVNRLLIGTKTRTKHFNFKELLGGKHIPNFFTTDPFNSKETIAASSRFWDPLSIGGGYSELKVEKKSLQLLQQNFNNVLKSMGKTSADMAKFSSKEWLEFFSVMESIGNIQDGTTKKLLAQAKEAQQEYEKTLKKLRDVIKEVAGSLGGDLKNALVSAFASGEDAAQNFKKSVSKVLRNLFLENIINKNFRKYFDTLQKEMETSFKQGGDQSWVDDIKRFSNAIGPELKSSIEAMKVFSEEMEKGGFSGFETDKSVDNSLKGAVKGMTETQADLLAGQFGGLRLTQLSTNKILKENHVELLERTSKQIEIQQDIEKNTRRTADNTEKLKSIDKTLTEIKNNKDKTGAGNGISG